MKFCLSERAYVYVIILIISNEDRDKWLLLLSNMEINTISEPRKLSLTKKILIYNYIYDIFSLRNLFMVTVLCNIAYERYLNYSYHSSW